MKNSASTPKQTKPALTTEQAKALEFLRRFLGKGTKVYTVLRHASASGTSRFIDLYVVKQNEPIRLTWSAAVMLEWTYSRQREALRVTDAEPTSVLKPSIRWAKSSSGTATHLASGGFDRP